MLNIDNVIPALTGFAGICITNLFGEWTYLFNVILILMFVDIISGALTGFAGGSTKSETGYINSNSFFKGIAKKIVMWCLIIVAYQVDRTLGINIVKSGVSYWLIASEGLSILENVGNLGINVPMLARFFEQIKDKSESEE